MMDDFLAGAFNNTFPAIWGKKSGVFHYPPQNAPYEVVGILEDVNPLEAPTAAQILFSAQKSAFATFPINGDAISLADGRSYKIWDTREDVTGWITLHLQRSA